MPLCMPLEWDGLDAEPADLAELAELAGPE
jgi:hypothetical protein